MADFSNMRNFPLKVIFLVHFLFISLSSLGFWTSPAYLFYNLLLILCLLWSIHHHDLEEPLQMTIVVNACSIILDVFLIAMGFPNSHDARERFSVAMAILHLILRPFTTIYLTKILQERSGSSGTVSDLFSNRNRSYEDMDRPAAPPQQSQGGYDFTTAQQI